MRNNIFFISILCFATVFTNGIIAQTTGDYRSKDSGDWTTASVWEWYNGLEWAGTFEAPTVDAGIISIRNGHTVAIPSGTNMTIDQAIVDAGGELQVIPGTSITINDGAGEKDLDVKGTLTLGGSVHGSGKVVINGICNWYYSRFSNYTDYDGISNTNFNIGTSGIMNLTGSDQKWLYGGRIYNSGTITIPSEAGNIHGISSSTGSAVLDNQISGVVNVKSNVKIYSSNQSGLYSYGFNFNNAGTLKKSTGSGTATLERLSFTNTGTVQVESGTLNIYSYNSIPGHTGTFTLTEGTTLIFDGYTEQNLGEGAEINGSGTVQIVNHNTNLKGEANGTIFGAGITIEFSSGSIGGPGKATINGIMNWTDGDLYGTLIIPEGAQLNISGTDQKNLDAGKIYNSGTISFSGTGAIFGVNGGLIENESNGVFDIQNDAMLYSNTWSGGPSPTFYINNTGTIKKTAGSGTTTIQRVTLTNTGLIQVQTGTLLFGDRATLNNTGILQVDNSTTCSITGSSSNFNNFSSNTLNSGTYNIAGTFKFNSANITTNNATIILDGASSKIVNESDVNALANFTTNGGSFTLNSGRDFSTNASTFTNNGTLNCGTNIFSGSGNFTNASGSTLIIGSPDGIASSGASGNIQSSGTRTFSTGANYTYNGDAAQVTGDGLPAQVNNFTINNSKGLSLTNSVSVSETFTLTDGNINTGSSTLTLGTGTSTLGTLERTSGTIIGNFKRWFSNSTVENVLFPVGTASNYRPANISFTSAPESGGTITSFFTASNPGTAGLPLEDGSAFIENIGSDGYWTLTPADDFDGGTYDLDLTADGFSGISDYTQLHLLKRSDSGSNWAIDGTHSICTGNNDCPIVHRTGLTSFSEFGIASTSENPLPVELVSFTANVSESSVILNWQTATEVNNYGFEVQRRKKSEAGNQDEGWEKIGFVEGHGNSNSPKNYSYTDQQLSNSEKLQYRLKQIDTDGTYEYSAIVEVRIESPSEFLLSQNYPNPFNPSTTISYQLPEAGLVTVKIYDILGKEIAVLVNEYQNEGKYTVLLNAKEFKITSGVYFYRISAGEFSDVKKLILVK